MRSVPLGLARADARNALLAKYRYKKECAPPFERSACLPLKGRRHIKRMSGCQIIKTRPVPLRLTHVVAPSPVRRPDASARSRWKRGRSVSIARGRSGPRPPAAPAGPRQTHSSHDRRRRRRRGPSSGCYARPVVLTESDAARR